MKFKIIPTIATVCLLALLLSLAHWQWRRSGEKRLLIHLQEQAAAIEVANLANIGEDGVENLRYRRVSVTGHYDTAHQFLIDNQVKNGKAGYFVLTPFISLNTNNAVLVNRGWVPLQQSRAVLPELSVHTRQATVNGRINHFPSVGLKLAGVEIPTNTWPSVVQVVDTGILAKKLGYSLFPFQIELDQGLPDGFTRDWQASALMSPEQHIAYAIQWLALALTLVALFIWYSCKNKND
ncbi:MAG: SURF1 family protein [Methylovulum sp.]|nr:SURF1 family protein [Methylovulum sp.]